jgi:hypothetical protein
VQLQGSPDCAAGLPAHSKIEHSLCGGSLGGRVCGSPKPRADLPPPFATGYRRVAAFFIKQYTNRSRHSGTAIVPTTSAAAIRCNSMKVVSPEAKVTDELLGPYSTKVWKMHCGNWSRSRVAPQVTVINSCLRKHEHPIRVEKRSVRAARTVGRTQVGQRRLERKERSRSWQETTLVSKCEGQNSEGAKSAVGEGESREEEWLTTGE